MAETNGNGHKKNGQGKLNGKARALVAIDRATEAANLFAQGVSVSEIAEQLSVHISRVYAYIAEARQEITRTNREYFQLRAVVFLENSFDALQTHTDLLRDKDWLKTADPERINAVREVCDSIARNAALFLAAGSGRPRSAEQAGAPSPASG